MHFGYTFHLFIATAKMKNSETTEKHKKKYQRKTFSLASTKYAGCKKKVEFQQQQLAVMEMP